jgi:carbonic anhydrase/acetyltransferase-like protein (isoleucine patch superfamily)
MDIMDLLTEMTQTASKYRLTKETRQTEDGTTLYRIQALVDFGTVRRGDLGGWIEDEACLSQQGYCWAFGDSQVYGDSALYGNAVLEDKAVLRGRSRMHGNIRAKDSVLIENGCDIFGESGELCGTTHVKNGVTIGGCHTIIDSFLTNGAVVSDMAYIRVSTVDGACVSHAASLDGGVYAKGPDVSISGNALVANAGIYDSAVIDGNATVGNFGRMTAFAERIYVHNDAHITGNACVRESVWGGTVGLEEDRPEEVGLAG